MKRTRSTIEMYKWRGVYYGIPEILKEAAIIAEHKNWRIDLDLAENPQQLKNRSTTSSNSSIKDTSVTCWSDNLEVPVRFLLFRHLDNRRVERDLKQILNQRRFMSKEDQIFDRRCQVEKIKRSAKSSSGRGVYLGGLWACRMAIGLTQR